MPEDDVPEADSLLMALREIALAAGAVVLAHYDRACTVMTKADRSPVTTADLAADTVICAGLSQRFPDIPVVSEERAESLELSPGARFFLVDPIDGTRQFIEHHGDFTVNIALIEDGAPLAGVVYAPVRDRLFLGYAARGALEEMPDAGARRPIRARRADGSALVVIASRSNCNRATRDYIARYRPAQVRNAGSSLKFCLLAAGEADLYPRFGCTMEWDTAAGHAVLAAAGGRLDRFPGGEALAYGKPGFRNPDFIAYGPGVSLV